MLFKRKRARRQACALIVRLHDEEETAQARDDARVWLARDPVNAAVPAVNRRHVLAGLSVAVVATVTAFVPLREAQATVYETGIGEQKRIALPDGSELHLDANSRVETHIGHDERQASVLRGRANFRIAPLLRQNFVVTTPLCQIASSGSCFDVSVGTQRQVDVIVVSGKALVSADHQPELHLSGGQRLHNDAGRRALDRPDLAPLLAWQDGYLVFQDETLASAAERMNNYSATRIIVDSDVAGRRISGNFATGDNRQFAASLAEFMPIDVRISDDQIHLGLRK